jgi:hypothetical protein
MPAGFILVDWSARIPPGLTVVDIVTTLAPFYGPWVLKPDVAT